MTCLVSVLIPAYNAGKYLGDTVGSVLTQTYPRVEMIIVNDGSRDDTLAVAKTFNDPRVKVIDQENRGAAAARNRAIAEAQGEFIQYLDADDLLHPAKITVQVARLSERRDCVAAGRWGRFTDDPANSHFVPEPFWTDTLPVEWLLIRWERNTMMHPAGWLCPRGVAELAGSWDEQLSLDDDGEYFGRVVFASREVLFCDDAVSFYRSGLPNSLSGRKSPAAWTSQFRSTNQTARLLLAADRSDRAKRACCRAYEEFVYASYPDVPLIRDQAWAKVRELGGPYFEPQMGPKMRRISRVIGWKMANRLRRFAAKIRRTLQTRGA